ncbi:hypothetical protein DFP72DRAFT_1076077 [Ephemerocybe angulata]|uniref:DUF6697 domain-containing protein n=1 Tax=Ephemerocybe angulata TaxID=980116 RepID=A0A8H6HID2_9AGAR|nr:hypothetical protein DFP72DRAFT_1076077 [Tulosesus angulatus]
MDLPPSLSTSATGNIEMSGATLRTIMDQLQRLNRNGDQHDQLIHDLRTEILTLKPQVETLQTENKALKPLRPQVDNLELENSLLRQEVDTLQKQLQEVASRGPVLNRRATSEALSYTSASAVVAAANAGGDPPGSQPQNQGGLDRMGEGIHEDLDHEDPVEDTATFSSQLASKVSTALKPIEVHSGSDQDSSPALPTRRSTRKRKLKVLPDQSSDDDSWEAFSPHFNPRAKRQKSNGRGTARKYEPAPASLSKGKVRAKNSPSKSQVKLGGSQVDKNPTPSTTPKTSSVKSLDPGPSNRKDLKIGARTKIPAHAIDSKALAISNAVVDMYLSSTPTLTIHPPPAEHNLPITMLGKEYGASTQALLWDNRQKATSPDQVKKFIKPSFETNPDMPAAPGEPGLLLCGRTELLDGLWSLFIRVFDLKGKDAGLKRWRYAGEYESSVVGDLGASDFAKMDAKVKETWGKKIADSKQHAAYVEMRARITLRKEGKAVTKANVDEEKGNIKKLAKAKAKSKVTAQDVVDAFSAGEEVIPIVRMVCVSYNHTFAQELDEMLAAQATN